MTMQAIWKDTIIAESNDTVMVEGNTYFPPEALNMNHFSESNHQSVCPWKGTASYYHVLVDGETLTDAAWTYTTPKEAAAHIKGRVAFWKGVIVKEA